MESNSILDLDLSYELDHNKYYITLAGKRLKTKQGNEIFTDSVVLALAVQDDYKEYKFKSKWINLISSYTDFINKDDDIKQSKEQIILYLKNDLLLYLDNASTKFFEFQESTYLPLIKDFEYLTNLTQKLVPTTGLEKINITDDSFSKIEEYVNTLTLKDLFVSLFLTRISTSSILTLLYLSKEKSVSEFYNIAFYAELSKLEQTPDDEELHRLEIIKQELEIINFFFKDGLSDG